MSLIFVFLLPIFSMAATLEQFHVCTVATKHYPNIQKLVQSCSKHHIDLKILGMGKPYPSGGIKFFYVYEYLQTLPDEEIVMFVDPFDVLIVADKDVILERFLQMDAPLVFAAEQILSPHTELFSNRFPPSPTLFRYLNTGTYIGYVGKIRKWLIDLRPDWTYDDQGQAVRHYVREEKNKAFYRLDYYCDLFLPLNNVKNFEVLIQDGEVNCISTPSKPCVIHANCGSFKIWDKIYEALIK